MKKILALALVLCTVATFAAGGKKPESLDLDIARAAVDDLQLMMAFDADHDMLLAISGIDTDLAQKGIYNVSGIIISASAYIVALPKDGKEAELRAQLDDYMAQLERDFDGYLADQYKLVQDRLMTTLETKEGTYIVYIVSSDNQAVLDAIKTGLIYAE